MFQNYSQSANALKNALEILDNLNKGFSYYEDVKNACSEIEQEKDKQLAQQVFIDKINPFLESSGGYLGNASLKPYIACLVILLNYFFLIKPLSQMIWAFLFTTSL